MDNLRKQQVIMVDRCCMCKRNEELMNHLLLHCEVVYALWNVLGCYRLCLVGWLICLLVG
jgi:hypothetical protein